MIFRKLFKEPGPPRSRPWEPGKEAPARVSMDWAALLPTSSTPINQAPITALARDTTTRQAAHLSPFYQQQQHTTVFPSHNSLDDQIYPGLQLRPFASHNDAIHATFQNQERLTSFINRPSLSSTDDKEKNLHMTTWKNKLSFTRHKDIRSNAISSVNFHKGNISEVRLQNSQTRSVFQRAVGVLKKGRLKSKRSCSVDLNGVPSDRLSYLPDEESLQHRARVYRGSLDSHFSSIRTRRGVQALSPVLRQEDSNKIERMEAQKRIWQGQQGPQAMSKPIISAAVNSMPVPDHMSLGSRQKSPLLPLKLYPPPTWAQTQPMYNQEKQLPVDPVTSSDPVGKLVTPSDPCTASTPGPKSNEREESWRQIRSEAVRKYEDWVVRSSQDDVLYPNTKVLGQTKVDMRKPSSTSINSEALHERLAELMKEDELRAAKDDINNPVSSHDKRAVFKARGEGKRSTELARVFPVESRQESLKPTVHMPDNESGPLTRRGFADKMFADKEAVRTVNGEYQNQNVTMEKIQPLKASRIASAQAMKRHQPLPDKPTPELRMSSAYRHDSKGKDRVDSDSSLLVVSPVMDQHLRSLSWGSLGPPTHLAQAKVPDLDKGKDSAKNGFEVMKPVQLMPQLGRSVDDLDCFREDSYVDSALTMEEGVTNNQRSLTDSQVETLDRIQNWRIHTGTQPGHGLYAPSANPTEPSAFLRGERDDQASSHITSISRRMDAHSIKKVSEQVEADEKEALDLLKKQECSSDISTVICGDIKSNQVGRDINGADMPQQHDRNGKQAKLVDVVSPPLSTHPGNGTKHMRRLSPDESRKLFHLLDDKVEATTSSHAPNSINEQVAGSLDLEAAIPHFSNNDRLQRWQALIQRLAYDLNDNVDTAVETLLNQYSEELRQFYKSNPEMLLFVSLKAKLIGKARDESTILEVKAVDTSSIPPVANLDAPTSSTQANCSFNTNDISSWLADEKQVQRALQKIIDYVESAGDITQVQKSLLALHQSLLDRSNDTVTMDQRLRLLEQAVYTQH